MICAVIRKKDHPIEYRAWIHMLHRCHNPTAWNYRWYGARGITVCDYWRESFANFLADMGAKPSKQHSLDRINNDGNYEPSNCRWATRSEQCNNTRQTRLITHDGVTLSMTQWARKIGIDPATMRDRLRHNDPSVAVSTPRLEKSRHIGRGWKNMQKAPRSKSGYKGVYAQGSGFMAVIKVSGKNQYLGFFKTAEDAAKAYNAAAIEHFGENARINTIGEAV